MVGDRFEIDLDPDHPDVAEAVTEVEAARARTPPGLRPVLWARPDTGLGTTVADRLGLRLIRTVLQLRRPLPVGESATIPVRPFRPDDPSDVARWLEVNNRAFAWHPEQANQTPESLAARMAEGWFDPEGFLVHERDGRMVGFCWTKVHAEADPPLGEIYVIGVDPEVEGRGLGRQLVLAGLDHLASRGLTVGMLYCEADNDRALRLYDHLGFRVHSADRCWAWPGDRDTPTHREAPSDHRSGDVRRDPSAP